MEYTNMIIILIIQYFKQMTTLIKTNTNILIVFLAIVFNRAIITGIHKGMANFCFA